MAASFICGGKPLHDRGAPQSCNVQIISSPCPSGANNDPPDAVVAIERQDSANVTLSAPMLNSAQSHPGRLHGEIVQWLNASSELLRSSNWGDALQLDGLDLLDR